METKTYGYFEGGQLFARTFGPRRIIANGRDGNPVEREVTVAEQVAALSPGWKPVDDIDDGRMAAAGPDEAVVAVPYDNGDRISYRYETVFDRQGAERRLAALKAALAAGDYRVIKCYEASLVGEELPYDVAVLHASRNAIRAQINDIEIAQAQLLDD